MPTVVDPAAVAMRRLVSTGTCLMSPADLASCLDIAAPWTRFGAHWDELAADSYAAELGTRRTRRYGNFLYHQGNGLARLIPHGAFVQPEDSNPLYVDRARHFQPLTEAFAADPLLHALLRLLGRLAAALDEHVEWNAKVTPFRVLASSEEEGQPTPEGLHRDGVTLVTSLLIRRQNAIGGESTVCDMDGHRLVTTTLSEPGTLLLGDDRRTLHGVSPIRPRDANQPAQRDVLVITFAPSS